jgi:iron complex transport system ATP-binding protein
MNTLEVQSLRFRYGRNLILDDVSMEAREGELVGILGPNGCGKTTLTRVMAGYLVPEAGTVSYNGSLIGNLHPRDLARLRAVVEQRLTSPFAFSVYDYVLLGRTPYLGRFQSETLEDHRIAEEALELTKTLHLHDREIDGLSGGELQRVMIARALAQQPAFLLLDEPTAHLDIRHQLDIMHLLSDLSRTIAVVTVLHDINHAISFCDRIVLLDNGHVRCSGAPEETLSTPVIRDVFGVDSIRISHPHLSEAQLAFSVPSMRYGERNIRLLVIGGGGSARTPLFTLTHAGYGVRAGVLNEGDRDLETARSLGITTLTAPPFSSIGSADKERLREWCRLVDGLVVTAMPVGEGNVGNLEVVCEFLGEKPVILFAQYRNFSALDHTGGRAESLYHLLAEHATPATTVEELLVALETLFP